MKSVKQVVFELTNNEKLQIISEFEQFEQNGYIGECLLREVASNCQGSAQLVSIFMNLVAFEVYRSLYYSQKMN